MYEEVEVRGRKGLYKVGYFDKNKHFDKPMLMQANVNLRRISKLVGSPAIEDWGDINMDVTLQAEWDQKVGKGKDWALRIAEEAPRKVELTPESKKWDDAIKALKSGNVKMDQIKAAYDISTKNEEALNEAIQS